MAIAKEVTKEDNETLAIEKFKARLKDLKLSYFHDKPFPKNESNKDAHAKCTNMEKAAIHCPNRYKAMMRWFDFAKLVSYFTMRLNANCMIYCDKYVIYIFYIFLIFLHKEHTNSENCNPSYIFLFFILMWISSFNINMDIVCRS